MSPSLTGADVLLSFLGYMAAYLVIFPAGLLIMARFVRKGPGAADDEMDAIEGGRPEGPVRALPQAERERRS